MAGRGQWRRWRQAAVCSALAASLWSTATAAEDGREIYQQRCLWCHGEGGRGDGPSAEGMFPRPRDFVRAHYRIRSTPHGQLPTDDDLRRGIERGLPGTPMPPWRDILSPTQIDALVVYLQSLSPRFQSEARAALPLPSGPASAARGQEIFRRARCELCHGRDGRGDGAITSVLNFEWGIPHAARDLTRGWTFKGGHEPADIYLRITGGLNGTPMGPYRELWSDAERWDLAQYVAGLDAEPSDSGEDFVARMIWTDGDVPLDPGAAVWADAPELSVPLGGQVTKDPPLRWWIPTAQTLRVQGLWNERQLALRLSWHDPTGPDFALPAGRRELWPDSAFIQWATSAAGERPYFLLGDRDHPVTVWHWRAGDGLEHWSARGDDDIRPEPADHQAQGVWRNGRWSVVYRRSRSDEAGLAPRRFLPVLFSVCDGANAEAGPARAISTWVYATLEAPAALRPWLLGSAWLLCAWLVQTWSIRRLRGTQP